MENVCQEENIDHIFKTCDLASTIWFTTNIYCPNPHNMDLHLIDWLEHI